MFDEIGNTPLPQREEHILKFWEEKEVFRRSLEARKDCPLYAFYDGPPFATGLPHYGHLLAGTIKDVVPRYKTMKGYKVPRRFGWDCHGIPIESLVQKGAGLATTAAIEEYGIGRFNELCRSKVLMYTEEWKKTVRRMGRWVDFDDVWHTMDPPFMESVWWAFKELYDKGLVYEGYKVMPFSPRLGTPLSNFEAGENYKDVDDPSITVAFPLREKDEHLLIWTTTPWTLVSNLAAAVGEDIDYVKVKSEGKVYILAKDRVSAYFSEPDIIGALKGKDLAGLKYYPPFDCFATKETEGAFVVLASDFPTTAEGTGIVHAAPAFGEDDFFLCEKAGIELVCPVDSAGCFTEEVPEYTGQFVKDADKDIISRLKEMGRLIQRKTIRHRYPYCPRTDGPLIYRAVSSWFVSVSGMRDQLLESNREIQWTPDHIKEGRFGKWLEGARDWAISRSRYWGTPIPLWRSSDGEILVLGSVKELENLSESKVTDLHRHHMDSIEIKKDGKVFRRIPDVFDCWFESGSMPYAECHYPFENQNVFSDRFPADFIAEGLDQTRGWFYTLTILSTALFGKPAFKNVVVNGIILAEDGQKMSKRLQNYPDPMEVIGRYGADAVRLYMLHSPAVRGDDLRFSERGVELVLRQILLPWWNAYQFFTTYARLENWQVKDNFQRPAREMDRFVLSIVQKLIFDVEKGMDAYELSAAVEPFVGFIDQLTNWYIRRSRRRFWEMSVEEGTEDAFSTLYFVLMELCRVAAPFVPFLAETMYQGLKTPSDPESVHLADYPTYRPNFRDEDLEAAMGAVQVTVGLGHALRKEHKLKVRQPLARATVSSGDSATLAFLKAEQHLIRDELNVKEVCFSDNEEEIVKLRAKPNFRTLGRRLGKLMRPAQEKIQAFDQSALRCLMTGESLAVSLDGETVHIGPEDVELDREVKPGLVAASEGCIAIALETELNDDLRLEGLARDFVNKVNTLRKEMGFEVSDRIQLSLEGSEKLKVCFEVYGEYISKEVLAVDVNFDGNGDGTALEFGDESCRIRIQKVGRL